MIFLLALSHSIYIPIDIPISKYLKRKTIDFFFETWESIIYEELWALQKWNVDQMIVHVLFN